eukprot:scaffold625_cov324-Pavlova_lutheri.AAC.23
MAFGTVPIGVSSFSTSISCLEASTERTLARTRTSENMCMSASFPSPIHFQRRSMRSRCCVLARSFAPSASEIGMHSSLRLSPPLAVLPVLPLPPSLSPISPPLDPSHPSLPLDPSQPVVPPSRSLSAGGPSLSIPLSRWSLPLDPSRKVVGLGGESQGHRGMGQTREFLLSKVGGRPQPWTRARCLRILSDRTTRARRRPSGGRVCNPIVPTRGSILPENTDAAPNRCVGNVPVSNSWRTSTVPDERNDRIGRMQGHRKRTERWERTDAKPRAD